MKACNKIRPLLEWLAANEIVDEQRHLVEEHVRVCPACRRELAVWRSLLAAAVEPAAATAAELQAIDWDAVSAKIMAGVVPQPARSRRPAAMFSLAFLAAAAALVAIVGLGLFLLTRAGSVTFPLDSNSRSAAAAVTRLQSGMARGEVISYLQQSQLMLTDLLNDCSSEEVAAREIGLYSRKAKELLLKKKYFQQNLPAVEWIKVKNVSERIDWLNYEILQLEDRQLCQQILRLQRIMENERLLLKIRLLERDLSYQPYQEV
ncbi:MAG: zf-HC2 domain-containing protein [Candidatus Aminicenantes bacterium]|nr:zf-HC2 domain-containing protein [Candidatus Aminicenantes bacterium]